MRKYLKESLHWLHLALFKPLTLAAESQHWTRRQKVAFYFRVLPVGLAASMILVALAGSLAGLAGFAFDWTEVFAWVLVAGLFGGLVVGLLLGLAYGLAFGLFSGLGFGLVVGLGVGLAVGLVNGLGFGLVIGLVIGMGFGLIIGMGFGMVGALARGLGSGLVMGLVVGLGTERMTDSLGFLSAYTLSFLLVFLRPFYLIPYAVQYRRGKLARDPFKIFRNSPVYWDEVIATPLAKLTDWLVRLVHHDRKRGLEEILFVAQQRPYQRRAAQRALIAIAIEDLQRIESLEGMARAAQLIEFLPAEAEHLPEGLSDARRRIEAIAALAQDFLTRKTGTGQAKILADLRPKIERFRDAMALVKPPVGTSFQPLASRWLAIAEAAELECWRRKSFAPLPNPFIVGNPLQPRDQEVFKGRQDIIIAIEENVINPAQRPALLLYGRRRIGKSSTLLHLPKLLSSQFVPVYIDCQNAKWREGDAAFCYHLAAALFSELQSRRLLDALKRPALNEFEKYPFTRLDAYLDEVEDRSRSAGKQILLTLDEYERLEEGITASKISTEIFNQLRNIVQHRERIVVLFSGSHHFAELRAVNWSHYLINVKTLELSFLSREEAAELITQPVPMLEYEPGLVDAILALTHCLPYLLQALASELVNHLNAERRLVATRDDLDLAVEKVLVTSQAYFSSTWGEDCGEEEREVLRALATDEATGCAPAYERTFLTLAQKEILERSDHRYVYTIELFRRWILKNQLPLGDSQHMVPATPGRLARAAGRARDRVQ